MQFDCLIVKCFVSNCEIIYIFLIFPPLAVSVQISYDIMLSLLNLCLLVDKPLSLYRSISFLPVASLIFPDAKMHHNNIVHVMVWHRPSGSLQLYLLDHTCPKLISYQKEESKCLFFWGYITVAS